jgi:hypothetical protein
MAIIPISDATGWDKSEEGLILSSFFWGYCNPPLSNF